MWIVFIEPSLSSISLCIMWSFNLHTHITHIQDVHNIEGPLVPYNHACPKRGLIHRDRESSVIRPLLYLQATTAGCWNDSCFNFSSVFTVHQLPFWCTTCHGRCHVTPTTCCGGQSSGTPSSTSSSKHRLPFLFYFGEFYTLFISSLGK